MPLGRNSTRLQKQRFTLPWQSFSSRTSKVYGAGLGSTARNFSDVLADGRSVLVRCAIVVPVIVNESEYY